MCLAVPGKVVEVSERRPMRMAKVDFGGVVKDVCLAYLPDVQVGDYAIVHVGFAIQKLDEASALQTLALFSSLGMLDEELVDEELVDGEPVDGEPVDEELVDEEPVDEALVGPSVGDAPTGGSS